MLSLLCSRSARRAFGAVLFAVLSVCCVRCSVLRSARNMSQPTLRGDLYAPCGRAPPLFCISRTPDTQHLVGGGWHTSRLWGNVLACAKHAPNLAVCRRRSPPRLGVVYIGRTFPHSRAVYPPPSLRAAADASRGSAPCRKRSSPTPPNRNCLYSFLGGCQG